LEGYVIKKTERRQARGGKCYVPHMTSGILAGTVQVETGQARF
jgi:hypothetical protein